MCAKGQCCCKEPAVRRIAPEECSPEQIRACHGDAAEHPCSAPGGSCDCGECEEPKGARAAAGE